MTGTFSQVILNITVYMSCISDPNLLFKISHDISYMCIGATESIPTIF